MPRFGGLKNIRSRFDSLVNKLSKFFKQKGYTDKYNLWEAMHSNDIGSTKSKQARQRNAVNWLKKFVRGNRDAQIKGKFLEPSMLYMFNYDTPKYESKLDFFDTQPLVLCMGVVNTSLGKREIGINLHLLPEQVRKVVLFKIFTVYKIQYANAAKQGKDTNFDINWKSIYNLTKQLGVGFAVRMYIPNLRTNTIKFPLMEWERAIWIPSKGYAKITPLELEKEWKKYITAQKSSATQRVAESDSFLN